MKPYSVLFAVAFALLLLAAQQPNAPRRVSAPIQLTAEQRAELQSKADRLDASVRAG